MLILIESKLQLFHTRLANKQDLAQKRPVAEIEDVLNLKARRQERPVEVKSFVAVNKGDAYRDVLKKKIPKEIFGCLHWPWERLRWQSKFCRTRFGMSAIIF